jgi:thiol-disulfide isomerase/thioredoxin
MSSIKVVIDTNVLLKTLNRNNFEFFIYNSFIEQKFDWIVSNEILIEYEEVLTSFYSVKTSNLVLEILCNANNVIFSDSILFGSGCTDFFNFLIYNFDRTIGRNNIYTKCPNPYVYPILNFHEIYKSNKYSEKIKEFLFYANLSGDLAVFGINSTIENLIEVFHQLYPESKFYALLIRDMAKLKNLSKADIAPVFKGKTPNGQLISLNDFKGKVLLIDVWATWCGPCKEELPYTHKIQEYFKSNKLVQVLYISIDSQEERWKSYLKKNKHLDGLHINIDDSDFRSSYKITGIPRYILIDRNGLIIDAFCDKPSNGKVEDKIKTALLNN